MKRSIKVITLLCLALCLVLCLTACGCKHTYDNDCDTTCNDCGEIRTVGDHTYTDATCTTPKTCTVCNHKDGDALGHTPANDDGDCTTAVVCLTCGEDAVGALTHADDNLDGSCDTCSTKLDWFLNTETSTCYVFTTDGLYHWANNLSQSNMTLMADIVLPDELTFDLDEDGTNDSNWQPVTLYATVEGNGHSIAGLKIDCPNKDSVGLFSNVMAGGKVQNLSMVDIDLKGGFEVGGIAAYNYGTIVNCSVNGSIQSTANSVGGIAGLNFDNGTIIACSNSANISGLNDTAGVMGGIVGQYNAPGGKVVACYNIGNITAVGSQKGGIAGTLHNGSAIACYSTGSVSDNWYAGAIAGQGNNTVLLHTYWSVPEGSVSNAHGWDGWTSTDGTAKEVDSETFSWTDAMNAMNGELERLGYEWRYVLNTGDDAETRPLLLQKVSTES